MTPTLVGFYFSVSVRLRENRKGWSLEMGLDNGVGICWRSKAVKVVSG